LAAEPLEWISIEPGTRGPLLSTRSAFEALGGGDVEPLVALIDPAIEWRGRRRVLHFWRPPPS
jgi:hypothetical protein